VITRRAEHHTDDRAGRRTDDQQSKADADATPQLARDGLTGHGGAEIATHRV
jgi:hypothetical protein